MLLEHILVLLHGLTLPHDSHWTGHGKQLDECRQIRWSCKFQELTLMLCHLKNLERVTLCIIWGILSTITEIFFIDFIITVILLLIKWLIKIICNCCSIWNFECKSFAIKKGTAKEAYNSSNNGLNMATVAPKSSWCVPVRCNEYGIQEI